MIDTKAAELIDYIHGAHTFGEKAGLRNMRLLLDRLGNPQDGLRLIHVAGTNGKGSVCAMIESALRANGLNTGLYTSPYLARYNERIRLNGAPIDDALLVRYGEPVRAAAESLRVLGVFPTVFELGTALAFLAFAGEDVDVAVIETGLGGRLDPTNVVCPMLCVICTIALDHMEILGGDLLTIAGEKAGIIKPGVPVALYPQTQAVDARFEAVAAALHAPLLRAQAYPIERLTVDPRGARFALALPRLGQLDVRIEMAGEHQAENARLALLALDCLSGEWPLTAQSVLRGLADARWPGRLEWVNDKTLLDGAHNPEGVRALVRYLEAFETRRPITLLTAMMRDKQPDVCTALLAPFAREVVTTQVDWPRAMPAESLAALYRAQGKPAVAQPDLARALEAAQNSAADGGMLLVAGSLYLIGALRTALLL